MPYKKDSNYTVADLGDEYELVTDFISRIRVSNSLYMAKQFPTMFVLSDEDGIYEVWGCERSVPHNRDEVVLIK